MTKTIGFLCLVLTGLVLTFSLQGCQYLRFLSSESIEADIPTVVQPQRNDKSFRIPPYLFITDFDIDRKLPLFRELEHLRDQVCKELKVSPSDKVIKVYLFRNKTNYEQYMSKRYSYLPNRRAYFITGVAKRPNDLEELMVFTYWSGQIQQDLRHEITHALLRSDLKDVPLWLDEGLAEYYEVPHDWDGINYQHLDKIVFGTDNAFRPNLAKLEQLRKVDDMNSPEYREAWAWTHWMLHGDARARQVLITYLHELKRNPNPGLLGPRLRAAVPNPEQAMLHHIRALQAQPRKGLAMMQ